MKPASLRLFSRLPGRRLRGWLPWAAGPALALGCTPYQFLPAPPAAPAKALVAPAAGKEPADPPPGDEEDAQAAEEKPEDLPPPAEECTAAPTAVRAPQTRPKVLPVDLDAVLRLAEEQNAQVGVAREKLAESHAEKDLADLSWLPNIHAGLAYYRHEGGIQDEPGNLVRSSTQALFPGLDVGARLDLREYTFQTLNAERQVLQQQGELSRITSETLLEAGNAYVDLLAARTSEAILVRSQRYEKKVLEWAEDLFKADRSAEVLVQGVRAQSHVRRQVMQQLRQQGDAAAVKLAYVLGLTPDVQLVPVDTALRPIALADATQPTDALVSQALASGPGVAELEQLLGLIQSGIEQASGPGRYLPVVEVRSVQGGFGAGPGGDLNWDDRWDLGLQLRWSLSGLCTARDRQRAAHAKLRQAQLSYDDLKGRLALGVQEAQQTVLAGQEQLRTLAEQVKAACQHHDLQYQRLKERLATPSEVMAAIQLLELGHLNALNAIRNHNKAQVRLMVLLGAGGHPADAPPLPGGCK